MEKEDTIKDIEEGAVTEAAIEGGVNKVVFR